MNKAKAYCFFMSLAAVLSVCAIIYASENETTKPKNVKERRIIVAPFTNSTGSELYDSLSDGMVWLVGGDLAKVKGFAVVEREELAKVVKEYKLQATGLIDEKSCSILGKFLNAELIVTGGFSLIDGNLRIDIKAVEISNAKIIATAFASGAKDKLVETEKETINALVAKIKESGNGDGKLSVDDTPEETLHYIRGLGHYYGNQYEGAIAEFMILAKCKGYSELGRYWIVKGYNELDDKDHCEIECNRYLQEFRKGLYSDEVRRILKKSEYKDKKE